MKVLPVAAAAAALFFPATALAECVPARPGQDTLDRFLKADGAITGRVLSREEVGAGNSTVTQTLTVYRIKQSYKKVRRLAPGDEVRVWSGGIDGVDQRVGSLGSILLDRGEKRWNGSLCSQLTQRDLRRAARDAGRA